MSESFDEALKRARAALRRETEDPYHISDRLLHEFAKEIEKAFRDGAQAAREDDLNELRNEMAWAKDPQTNKTAEERTHYCASLSNSIARISSLDPKPAQSYFDKLSNQFITVADNLAAEAQSYLQVGHATGDEDQPLEEALNAYRALRCLPQEECGQFYIGVIDGSSLPIAARCSKLAGHEGNHGRRDR